MWRIPAFILIIILILFTTHVNAAPVYVSKDSRAYHHNRNCSNITTTDGLMEFNSPEKAAGAIPCEYCNPSSVRSIDEQQLQYGNSNKVPIEQSMISSKQTPAREPGDVIELWNDALSNGDVNIARKYTSMTLYSTKYYESIVSLENLSEIYQKSKNYSIKSNIIDSKIDGDIAWVIYNVTYKDGSVKQWKDKLLLENGQWKVAPQFNVVENAKQQDKPADDASELDMCQHLVQELEAEVASLRVQLAKKATPLTPQNLSGTYHASKITDTIPEYIKFDAPGICEIRMPNGEIYTATFEKRPTGLLIKPGFGVVFFAKRIGKYFEITRGGQSVTYSKR